MKSPSDENQYIDLMNYILEHGSNKPDRTGTGTISVFGHQLRFNLENNTIPILTTKKVFIKGVIKELLWFISGNTNITALQDDGINIWNEWADQKGDLGPVYGEMWRSWPGTPSASIDYNSDKLSAVIDTQTIDQLSLAIEALKTNPNDRRIIVSSWNPALLPNTNDSFEENVHNGKQALPPCHCFFQFWTDGNGNLSCKLTQRSADLFLGVPFNIAQYSLLTHMVAHVTGLTAKEFIWSGGDIHIYNNHINQCKTQIGREIHDFPTVSLSSDVTSIDDFTFDDITIHNYVHGSPISAEVSI